MGEGSFASGIGTELWECVYVGGLDQGRSAVVLKLHHSLTDGVGGVSLLDAAYYATVTLSTTGYGDITPVCDSSRLANVFVITPLRFLFLIVLVIGITTQFLLRRREARLIG